LWTWWKIHKGIGATWRNIYYVKCDLFHLVNISLNLLNLVRFRCQNLVSRKLYFYLISKNKKLTFFYCYDIIMVEGINATCSCEDLFMSLCPILGLRLHVGEPYVLHVFCIERKHDVNCFIIMFLCSIYEVKLCCVMWFFYMNQYYNVIGGGRFILGMFCLCWTKLPLLRAFHFPNTLYFVKYNLH